MKPKFLLIIPKTKSIETFDLGRLPVGLASISANLRHNGIDVKFIDMPRNTEENLNKILQEWKPDYAGLSMHEGRYTDDKDWKSDIEKITGNIRKQTPGIILFAGGLFPTVSPEKFTDLFDYIVRGDGEVPLVEFIKGQNPKTIDGFYFKDKEGNIVDNDACRKPQNLDELPFPDYETIPLESYDNHFFSKETDYPIISARGCINKCIYCSRKFYQDTYRNISPERIIEEIKQRPEGRNAIVFGEHTFNADRERTMKFCRLLQEENMGVIWTCLARIDKMDEELIDQMYLSGCRDIMFGIETGSRELMNKLNRDYSLEEALKTVIYCKKKGIRVATTFMYGLPGERKRDLLKTFTLAMKMPSEIKVFLVLNLPMMLKRGGMTHMERQYLQMVKDHKDPKELFPKMYYPTIIFFALFSNLIAFGCAILKNTVNIKRRSLKLRSPFSLKQTLKHLPSIVKTVIIAIIKNIFKRENKIEDPK